MTRKPISVVKTVLHRNCSLVDSSELIRSATDPSSEDTWCDYAPFGSFISFPITKKNKSTKPGMLSSHWSSRPATSIKMKREMKGLMRFAIRKPIKIRKKKKKHVTCVLDNLFVTCEQAVCMYSELRLFCSNMCLNSLNER